MSDPILREWLNEFNKDPNSRDYEHLVQKIREDERSQARKEYLNPCMFCGYDEWSTYVCEDCNESLETKDENANDTSIYAEPYYSPQNAINVVVPEYSMDSVSQNLRDLTKKLQDLGYEPNSGLLGGEYGYGVIFENDVFMMHPFCWCDKENCAWCIGCSCPDEAHEYIVEGETATFNEWIIAYDKGLERGTLIHKEHQCDYCKGLVGHAPNFLHKPSNSKIFWYKYIGRNMEIELFDSWETIYKECIDSLTH